jgi:hypothetical protein
MTFDVFLLIIGAVWYMRKAIGGLSVSYIKSLHITCVSLFFTQGAVKQFICLLQIQGSGANWKKIFMKYPARITALQKQDFT